jgi:uncharacterized protein
MIAQEPRASASGRTVTHSPSVSAGANMRAIFVDERRARRTATAAGLSVTVLLGVVARAKRAGLIDMGKPVVDELIHVARFWIGPDLYAEVLAELGES